LGNSPGRRVAAGRPCLAVEKLEDRNLLSASPHSSTSSAISTEPPPTSGDTQVLIGLLQGGLKVTQDEFQLLKACASGKHIAKAVIVCRQLDGELIKVGQDLIKGELTDLKLMAAEAKIDFLKIKLTDIIISSVDAQTLKTAQPILDSLFVDAASLVKGLVGVQGAGTTTHKQTLDYIKISADVLKIDGLIIKGELDLLRKAGKGQQEFFKLEAKIEDVFQKAN
jgi:type VI protein secretion system component Hcp